MKRLVLVSCVVAALAAAQDVSVPWEEFKSLYRERIEKEVLMQTAPPALRPLVYSIDEARYHITVAGGEARGDVLITGKILGGDPEPIPLFGADIVLTDFGEISGGALLGSSEAAGAAFLPAAGAAEFQLVLGFLVPVTDDNEARALSFNTPRALRNSLKVTLPEQARILEHPGIRDGAGVFHFAPSPCINLRYLDRPGIAGAGIIEIDAASRIRVDTNRVFIETHFQPVRTLPETIVLQVPPGAAFISSSLQSSRIHAVDPEHFELSMASNGENAFSVEVAIDGIGEDGLVAFQLPTIVSNSGRQGRFVVDEPDHGQLSVDAEGLIAQIPIERLGEVLQPMVQPAAYFMTVPPGAEIQLAIKRFQPVETPAIVLDSQYFFASFDDNGTALSTLVMDVPAEVGARIRVNAVPGAEIWSLTVNGAKAAVYKDESDVWIIPLAPGHVSHVELAFLRHGPPLGLQGTVDAAVPATGIPSRDLRVAIALPARVELLVLEGPVNAAAPDAWAIPADLAGNKYSFSQSFYKGDGISISASYKEPMKQGQ
jgi:hypothetical protein